VVILLDIAPDNPISLKEDLIYIAASRAISRLIIFAKKSKIPAYLKM